MPSATVGQPIDQNIIVNADYTEIGAYNAMERLLAQDIDAVFVASDTMAKGAMRAIHARNLQIPQDIAVVGFDGLNPEANMVPALTTVRQSIKRIGSMVVDTLIDVIENGITPTRRLVLPTELIIRESCGTIEKKTNETT